MIILLVQQKRKHNEMVFLTSNKENKHVLLTLGIDYTARDTLIVKYTRVPT